MSPWAVWMINHRLTWLLKILVILLYPVVLLTYCRDAAKDIQQVFDNIDHEESK